MTTLGFAGGLIFGWNAFALILKAQGNYDKGCTQPIAGPPFLFRHGILSIPP